MLFIQLYLNHPMHHKCTLITDLTSSLTRSLPPSHMIHYNAACMHFHSGLVEQLFFGVGGMGKQYCINKRYCEVINAGSGFNFTPFIGSGTSL